MKTPLTTTMFLALALTGAPALADDHRPGGPGNSQGNGHAYGHDDHDDDRDDHGGFVPGYAVTGMSLANRSGLELSVWVDGTFRGPVRVNDTRTFSDMPGAHQVLARGADGSVVFSGPVVFTPRGLSYLEVVPPFAMVTLFNNGSVPLFVSAGPTSLWIVPGARQEVRVPAGCSHVLTSISGPRGAMIPVGDFELRATGGQRLVQDIGWSPPPRMAHATITNHERVTVRIYVDNRQVLSLRPGEQATLDLTGGRHQVFVAEAGGRVLFNAPIDVRAGTRSDVDIWHGVHVQPMSGSYVARR